MFDIDRWQEVFTSIRKNWLRTLLAGATIAMGLFIFIILFGLGNGLRNGFKELFIGDATNTIYIGAGATSKAHAGYQEGRVLNLENENLEKLRDEFDDDLQVSSGRLSSNVTARYKTEYGTYRTIGVHNGHDYLEDNKIIKGRFLSESDLNQREKYAVIGRLVEKDLFKNENPMGKNIILDGISFRVIGVFKDSGGDNEERRIYVPITTQQTLYKGTNYLDNIFLAYNPEMSPSEAIAFGEKIEEQLKKSLFVHPDDNGAIFLNNKAEGLKGMNGFLGVLIGIVFFVGGGTLIAGIIGISNIMIYIVKERTKEIGIRKALGAKPASIVGLILHESILVTVLSGFFGVGVAILILNSIGDKLEDFFIVNPEVKTGEIVMALVILISCGLLAGFVPARRASKIKPIEALRTE